ncbi:MAG: hypothetical protein LUC90_10030 [Lachnospiraceae bacterium]|nr:hypothetical protein [Lachnospiraceae bacterium]
MESGTHRELMAAGGIYCTMFSTQANRYLAEGQRSGEEAMPGPEFGGVRPGPGMRPEGKRPLPD